MTVAEITWVAIALSGLVAFRFGLPLLLTWLVGSAVDHSLHPQA